MIAVDTNILVRYFADDDPAQSALARRFVERDATTENPGFICLITLVELLWVLNDTYKIGRAMQREIVSRLLELPNFVIEAADLVEAALALEFGDISDRIIHYVGTTHGCTRTVTFDKKFARLQDVELLG